MARALATTPLQSPVVEFWDLVQRLTALEERLAASLAVLLVALVVGRVLLPFAVRLSVVFVKRRVPRGRVRRGGEWLSRYVPTTLSKLSLFVLQFSVCLAAMFVLLVLWERVDAARQLLIEAGITPGRLWQLLLTVGLFLAAYVLAGFLRELIEQYSDGADQITTTSRRLSSAWATSPSSRSRSRARSRSGGLTSRGCWSGPAFSVSSSGWRPGRRSAR